MNTALAQMDRITQSNAATAEQNAASSSELLNQAGQVNNIVSSLAALIGSEGGNGSTKPQALPDATRPQLEMTEAQPAIPASDSPRRT